MARRLALVVVLLIACGAAAPAAQYFGENKVRYRTFSFQVLKTTHFDIYYYPDERPGVDTAARLAERWYARLERSFGHRLRGRQALILYASHSDFTQTNIISGAIGEGTGGLTEAGRRRIVLPLAGTLADTDHVIGHELVHAFQFDLTAPEDGSAGYAGALALPLWFVEGMAEYLSLGSVDPNTAMWVRAAARRGTLPRVRDLGKSRYFPYRWGQAFWAYVGGRWNDRVLGEMLRVAASRGVDAAIKEVLGTTPERLSTDWHRAITRTYAASLEATAAAPGRRLVAGNVSRAPINIGPSISPDGQWVAFLAERDFGAVDLYVADARTGRTVRRLTRSESDPHYSTIQFLHSAGTWDAQSRRLAIVTMTGGQPAIAVFDVASGERVREILIRDVDEVWNPAWAPDGRSVAFTGLRQGLTDLYVYELDAARLRRLTHDIYADLQPAWSPDGGRIAFATDRFTADVGSLAPGPLHLAILDVTTGALQELPATAGKQIAPQWSPDGEAIYYIGDAGGIANVHHLSLADGGVSQVSRVVTGVTGITATSPALSVAAQAGTVVFSVYDDGGIYDIYAIDAPVLGRRPVVLDERAGALPPAPRGRAGVNALIGDASFGLPEPDAYPSSPYRPRLALEAMGQPSIGVGVSRFGTSVAGGVSFLLGDLLEDHLVAGAVDVTRRSGWDFSARDIGAQLAYINRRRRWTWGVAGGHIPYLSGGYITSGGSSGNPLVADEQLIIDRQTEWSGAALAAYPFDRARRVELQAGVSHVAFDRVISTTTYSVQTGQIYEVGSITTPRARPLALGTAAGAYVFDTSSFGATSPVRGERYRLELEPAFGTITFAGVLADYRRYFMPAPFYTVAGRVMHYGRYGAGAADARLIPLYVGHADLVRGYDLYSINTAECGWTPQGSCPLLDRMTGSRLLVGGLEFRFPLLRPWGVSRGMYGPIPIEVALFTDAGVAWDRGQRPAWLGGARDGVTSAGVTFRVNLFGMAVAQFDAVRPFQRPAQGWMFTWNLLQGW